MTDLRSQLIRDEGQRLKPYRDTANKLTIGVGRNLDDDGITQDECDLMLSNDIQRATNDVLAAFPWAGGLDPVRLAVLTNMCFNMGVGGLAEFKHFLAAMQAGDWVTARNEMLDSAWASETGPRAQRLAIQVETGCWQ